MLDIKEIYEGQLLKESAACKHIFQDGDMTFAELRDLFTNLFSGGGVMLSNKVPSMNVLVTYKDGEFCIETDLKKLDKPCCYGKLSDRCCDAGKNVKAAFMSSIRDLVDALKVLDPILLNKFFANGQNFIDCQVIFPPEEECSLYGDKCFMSFNGLKCYDSNFKCIGDDEESGKELFDMLRSSTSLEHEVSELANDNAIKLHRCVPGKKALDAILEKLNELINGVGWGCSINSYIQDKYSRYIINKALEHGLDVSRNSAFVNELVSRLSKTKTKLRPTKSDLVTFAKREGLNCHSDEYKSFLDDIETNCDQTNAEIISPIENLIYYGAAVALNGLLGYMAIDPNLKTQKFLGGIDGTCCMSEGEEYVFKLDKLDALKKSLSKVASYVEALPKNGITIMYKGQPYSVLSKIGALDKLCEIVGC